MSSRKMWILPWPSSRVIGSMRISRVHRADLFVFPGRDAAVQQRSGQAVAVERADRVGDLGHAGGDLFLARRRRGARRSPTALSPRSRRTLLVGPMQPVQGMFPPMQAAPQPARVAGPRQARPWASRHRSGSASVCVRPPELLHRQLVGLVAARGHSEHSATSGASTAPLAGSLPSTSAVTAEPIRAAGGGQPGR